VKRLRYLVRINKDTDSDWGASVPDLPGCVATGKTIDATLRRIQVAIQLHIRGMRADGVRPPPDRGSDPLSPVEQRGKSTSTQRWRLLPEARLATCVAVRRTSRLSGPA
jgi:predicted RNase H-like HicB family nuclease